MLTRHYDFWPKRVPKTLSIPETSLYYNLEVSARRYSNKAAMIYYDTPISYRQLDEEVVKMAGFLQNQAGVLQGERVLLYMQNSPQFIIAFYAILRANAVVVPINPMNVTEELRFYIHDSDAKVAIIGHELYPRIEPLIGQGGLEHVIAASYSDYILLENERELPDFLKTPLEPLQNPNTILWQEALSANLKPSEVITGSGDICVLPYTSGTTGRPKGCIHTHQTVQAIISAAATWTNANNGVVLSTLPLFHVTGLQYCMNLPILSGSTMIMMTRWDRDLAAAYIERYQCTSWINISTMVIDFLSNPNITKFNISSLLSIGGGGAALPEAIGEKLYQLTGLRYMEGYGLTETISTTHSNPPDRSKMQCLGIPFIGVDSRIINPDTLQELGPNEEGEVIINGPQVLKEYWKRPEDNEKCFIEIDGKIFFRTGDIAKYDEEGYFFIVDRVKRMINASGFKVWPTEVESVLYKHPAVNQACVIGIPDERRGESVKAFIVLQEGSRGLVTEEEIIEWSKMQMAAYKYPRVIEFTDKLPISGSGKILWRQLQEEELQKLKQ